MSSRVVSRYRYRDMEERLIENSFVDNEWMPGHGGDHGPCWLWLGARSDGGYGSLNIRNPETGKVKKQWAHRVSFETFKGPIPEGMQVDHQCRNACCIAPDHLMAIPGPDNLAKRIWRPRARPPSPTVPLWKDAA